mmetsp:Transcript_250/g.261  ORF Transcript_250/g.261 Transcript_250/m.261 type:complete len:116 (-) Transcript_250:354-701(-)
MISPKKVTVATCARLCAIAKKAIDDALQNPGPYIAVIMNEFLDTNLIHFSTHLRKQFMLASKIFINLESCFTFATRCEITAAMTRITSIRAIKNDPIAIEPRWKRQQTQKLVPRA